MPALRLVIALLALALAAFCVFGFLATFEPPGAITLRIVYAVVELAALGTLAWLSFSRRPTHRSFS